MSFIGGSTVHRRQKLILTHHFLIKGVWCSNSLPPPQSVGGRVEVHLKHRVRGELVSEVTTPQGLLQPHNWRSRQHTYGILLLCEAIHCILEKYSLFNHFITDFNTSLYGVFQFSYKPAALPATWGVTIIMCCCFFQVKLIATIYSIYITIKNSSSTLAKAERKRHTINLCSISSRARHHSGGEQL